jgi:hypothetical protein
MIIIGRKLIKIKLVNSSQTEEINVGITHYIIVNLADSRNPHGAPLWSSGSVLAHRSPPSVFESPRGHI